MTNPLCHEIVQASAILLSHCDLEHVNTVITKAEQLRSQLWSRMIEGATAAPDPNGQCFQLRADPSCPAVARPPHYLREVPKDVQHKWLNGEIHRVIKGVDFGQEPTAFGVMMHNLAKNVDMKCAYKVLGDTVTFQCTKIS